MNQISQARQATRTRLVAVSALAIALVGGSAGLMTPAAVGAATATAPGSSASKSVSIPGSAAQRCANLNQMAIPAGVMSLPTRGGRVESASESTSVVSGKTVEYCQVDADLFPVDPSAPDIKMRLDVPLGWNDKAVMFGGGGYDGTIPDLTENVPFGPADQPVPLARGYATFGSDSGHQQNPTRPPSLDGSFGMNDEALRNFAAGDALKKTRDAAVFLMRRGFGKSPREMLFAGGSTGGREALVVAQRWPKAFDGVIAAYPAWNNLAEVLDLGYLAQVLSRPDAFPGPDKQTLLYDSVMSACDGLDGLQDGVISNPRACHFNPETLRCPDGADTGPTCLSDAQIKAVVAMSSSFKWSYPVASGETHYPGFPILSGADMRVPFLGWGTTPPANPMPATSGYGMQYWDQWVKYFLTRDPNYNSLDVDPRHPGKWLNRISYLSTIEDRNDADLAPFMRAGGKLLLLHGAADELVSHRSTNDYYRRVRATVGADNTNRFMRYYVVPGANHANFGTPAFVAQWDSLTALERWIDNGKPPVHPVVTDGNNGRTRPLCRYPRWPEYRSGDPNSAASFACVR